MPELPEVEITARLLDRAVKGAPIESALAPGINALKTFDPPLHAIEGAAIAGVRRRGKHLVVDVAGGLALLADQGARPLHAVLRDQRVISGIGRSWVDEILWTARLSPFKRADDLDDEDAETLRAAMIGCLDGAIEHYERVVELPIPDKLPMPLEVHRHQGEPCPRCGATLEAVHYEDYVMSYCPQEQTGGRVLKDRRLSRLLK